MVAYVLLNAKLKELGCFMHYYRGEILSDNMRGLMLPYGDAWRRWRRVLHSGFHSRRAETYKDIQSVEAKVMLYELLHDPDGYQKHLQR